MNKLLQGIVEHAFSYVPYYQELAKTHEIHKVNEYKDFQKIPITRKKDMMQNEFKHISGKYRTQFYNGMLFKYHTSGSTGNCLNVYWSLYDEALSNLCSWKWRTIWYGIKPGDRHLSFHTTLYSGNSFIDNPDKIIQRPKELSLNKLYLNSDHINDYCMKIKQFQPVWISVQPSVLTVFLSLLPEQHKDTFNSVKYVELNGEYLTSATLGYLKEALPAVIFSNLYGAIEIGAIGLTCPMGHMHILTNNAYVEILSDGGLCQEGEEGRVIVTSLKNICMPFIRYDLGDLAALGPADCSCGCGLPTIQVTAGRVGQNISLSGGVQLPCYVLLYPIEKINSECNGAIAQFQVNQLTEREFSVTLYLKPGYENWFSAIKKSFCRYIKEVSPAHEELHWDIRQEKVFAYTEENKFQFFIKQS